MTCEETTMESGTPESFFHHVLRCLLHDNARHHITQIIQTVFTDYKWETMPHPGCSSDISPDFKLFPKLKEPLHDQDFSL